MHYKKCSKDKLITIFWKLSTKIMNLTNILIIIICIKLKHLVRQNSNRVMATGIVNLEASNHRTDICDN